MARKDRMNKEEMIQALSKEGILLFREYSGLPLNQAQRNLAGRTHYVDDSTIRSFNARVHSVHIIDDGLLLGMVESLQKSFNADEGRVYRPVFFDLFGNIVYRPDIGDSFSDQKKAQADFWKQADLLDAENITIKGIEKKYDALEQELKEWKKFWDIFN
jgi:hypothetical protein